MLYAKLRIARIYQEEMQHYEKALQKAKAADPLTTAGERHRNKIPRIKAKLDAAKTAYNDAKQDILEQDAFQQMSSCMQKACIAYYIDHKTEAAAQSIYYSSSFLRDVRNYCHKI